jgi:hypothetical protein
MMGPYSHSTAYDGCPTHCICLGWIREPFHMGLEPQPLHKGFIHYQGVTRDFIWLPKFWLAGLMVMAWWWIHIPIHSIWWLSNTLYMFGVDKETIPHGFGASTTAQRLHLAPRPRSDPRFHLTSQILIYMSCGNGMMTDPYPHPQHMKVVKHLVYVWSG